MDRAGGSYLAGQGQGVAAFAAAQVQDGFSGF